MRERLESLHRKTPPLAKPLKRADTIWVEPDVIADIAFTELTQDGEIERTTRRAQLRDGRRTVRIAQAARSCRMKMSPPTRTARRAHYCTHNTMPLHTAASIIKSVRWTGRSFICRGVRSASETMDRDVVNLAMFGMHQHLSTHAADKINCVIARVEDRRRVNGVADKGRNYQCEARAWVGAHGCSPPLHRRERYSVSQSPAPCHRAVAGDQSVIEHRCARV